MSKKNQLPAMFTPKQPAVRKPTGWACDVCGMTEIQTEQCPVDGTREVK